MHHHYIDELSFGHGLLHHFDPRSKLICILVLIVAVVTLTALNPPFLLLTSIILILGTIVSKLPILFMLKRTLIVFPFVMLIALVQIFVPGTPVYKLGNLAITQEGIVLAKTIGIKAILSVYAVLLLVSTTRFTDIMQGLATWKFPPILLSVLSFLYRYLFILLDEAMILKRAMDTRAGKMPRFTYFKYFGTMIGMLFVRTYYRAERIYQAMLSRGYDGTIYSLNVLKWHLKDSILLLCIIGFIIWGRLYFA